MAIIGEIWTAFKEIQIALKGIIEARKILGVIACSTQIYLWVMTMQTLLGTAEGLGDEELGNEIAELLGISDSDELKKVLSNTENAIVPYLNKIPELQTRLQLQPSALEGSHTPPYKSTVFIEISYAFDNLIGTGTMILFFNPEGFNWKPKTPKIIRNVSESEAAAFLGSKSWGNYWRENYLIKNRPKHFNKVKEDIVTGEFFESPEQEDLDKYIEALIENPDNDNVIEDVLTEQMSDALDKQMEINEKFISSIENDNFGRPFEDGGLRLTDALGNRIKRIPKKLNTSISNNPFLKDIAKYKKEFKQASIKLRNLKGLLKSALANRGKGAYRLAVSQAIGGYNSIRTQLLKNTESIGRFFAAAGINAGVLTSNEIAANLSRLNPKITNIVNKYSRWDKMAGRRGYESYTWYKSELKRFQSLKGVKEGYWASPKRQEKLLATIEKRKTNVSIIEKQYKEAVTSGTLKGISGGIKDVIMPPKCITEIF